MNFDNVEEFIIFEAIVGSRLYGVNTDDSDYDYRGVCIPPMEVLLNPFQGFEQKDSGFKEEDRTIFALGKFMKLCADNNPNIIELLFVPQQNMVFKTPIWDKIIKNKDLFISKKSKFSFTGYAISQLKRIERHRKWLLDPPKEEPTRKMFGLKGNKNISNAWRTIAKTELKLNLMKEEFHDEYKAEVAYSNAKEIWDKYASWRKGRNPKRKEMEKKWGFDCKHASHLFRLMTEGKELLLTGNITFPLPNADFILDVKDGRYKYDEVLEMAKDMESEFEIWYEESTLPKSADREKLAKLYYEIVLG